MGDIISFRPRELTGGPPADLGPANILFFTGVRYQRDDAHTVRPAPKPSAPADNRGGKLGGRRRRRG